VNWLASFIGANKIKVMVTTEGIKHAKLQSNRHHQQTNTQLFYGHALPVAQPTVSTSWRAAHRLASDYTVSEL